MPEANDLPELARTVALLADAVAQYLDGSMSQQDAAANLHALNADAQRIWRALEGPGS